MFSPTVEELRRFWASTCRDESGCVLWTGPAGTAYGRFSWRGTRMDAHRWIMCVYSFRRLKRREYVLHSCDTPMCVNTAHVKVGNSSQNALEMWERNPTVRKRAQSRSKTECKFGHAFDESNTYYTPKGSKSCRTCRASAARKFRRKQRKT